ncbi:MAG: glycerate kinase [Armatimonadetes bacterium]|nr:glycerate kinase [Armatimonadota bacterium]
MSEEYFHILLAPNAFKGSLTAHSAALAMEEGVRRVGRLPNGRVLTAVFAPLADGGDGTLETLVSATQGTLEVAEVQDPLGRPVLARWGRLGGERAHIAVIEMAEASGLRLLKRDELDPRRASTYGTGQLMREAIGAGCRELLVAIGGSATNDGGAGMAQALGARLRDARGRELAPGGANLHRLATVDMSDFLLPAETRVMVACDVNNPLCGAEGASAIYGPQKGATSDDITSLDEGLRNFAKVIKEQLLMDVAERPGAGAAGGLGAGLMAFCGAELRSGIDWVMDVIGFENKLAQCHLVLTGEGRVDGQTVRGKVISGVAQRAKARGIPVIALAGSIEEGADALLNEVGVTATLCILNSPCSVDEAMLRGYALLADTTERVLRILAIRVHALGN